MKAVSAILLASVALATAGDWCYNKESCGPNAWGGECQVRDAAARQTPIDLEYQTPNSGVPRVLEVSDSYNQNYRFKVSNNGHTASITLEDATTPLTMAGELTHGINYTFAELHFHWGSNASVGSEHTIRGKQYSLEAHLVHYRTDLGSCDAAKASTDRDALSVIGILFEESENGENENLKPITDVLQFTRYAGESYVGKNLNLFKIIPEAYETRQIRQDTYVANYYGSLTTPGCNQIVLWNVCTIAANVMNSQMQQFRSMFAHGANAIENEYLVDNFRPKQNINGRKIEVFDASVRRGGNGVVPL